MQTKLEASMRHSDCCNRIRLFISEIGGLCIPYTVGMFRPIDSERRIKVGRDGVSDLIACVRGRFLGIEVKVGRDQQRDDQKSFQEAVEAASGIYVLARFTDTEDGVEAVKRAIDDDVDSRIQHWSEWFGVNMTVEAAEGLKKMFHAW